MRKWRKTWGMLAGGLAYLGGMVSAAHGQFGPPPGGGGYGMPPGGMMGMPPGGAPGMPASMPPGGGGFGPGAFASNPHLAGTPADFPNPGIPSKEGVSPLSLRDDGAPNAFTELCDNRRPRSPSIVFRGEYIGWWISKGPVRSPLVTTTTNFAGGEVGGIDEPNTVILVPASTTTIDYGMLTGVRLAMGIAVDWCPPIEVSGFSITRNFIVFSDGSTDATGAFLARPVQLVDVPGIPGLGLNSVEFVNVPGLAAGHVDIRSRLSMWNVETNVFFNFADNGTIRLDLLLGYRHMDLYESLEINNTLTGVNANVNFGGATFPLGFTTVARDAFRSRNGFDGGQIGVRGIFECTPQLKIFVDSKLALGVTHQFLTIDGTSTLFPNNGLPTVTESGGILALRNNIGVNSNREFTIIPEVNLSLSYQCTQHLRLYGGYNFLYWSNVIRAGDYANNAVDSRNIPTDQNFIGSFKGGAPTFPQFLQRNFYAHGWHVGVEIGF